MLHLGRADAERQRAERPVRARVRVAADDGHTRPRQPQFRPDDVNNALFRVEQIVQRYAELAAVALQRLHLLLRDGVLDRPGAVGGGDVVVHGRGGQLGAAHLAPGDAQAFEGLRRGDLVDQVQVNVEERRASGLFVHDVRLPHFFEHGFRHSESCLSLDGGARDTAVLALTLYVYSKRAPEATSPAPRNRATRGRRRDGHEALCYRCAQEMKGTTRGSSGSRTAPAGRCPRARARRTPGFSC